MIDPMTSLAFSMHASKGVYALLLGSGISRPAGIPTGWEIVTHLTQQLAHLRNQNDACAADPEAWFRGAFGADPEYTAILEQLTGTPEERHLILKGYFEPNEEEREQGLKSPTEAHRAIAELMASGHVRVVITTNFDRLLEQALDAQGTRPQVISTADAADGALPLVHTEHCIIKVNGDYMDTRIRNTAAELAAYDPRTDALLDEVLDQFGLVVCGWSGEWDTALRVAIERCRSRRFCMYWTAYGEPSDCAKRLVELRAGQLVSIENADTFFCRLADSVKALDSFASRDPVTPRVVTARAKRYISEERFAIQLHDLVMEQTAALCQAMLDPCFATGGNTPTDADIRTRFVSYESVCSSMQALVSTGCYWGGPSQSQLWRRCIERVASLEQPRSGYDLWLEMQLYPALLLLYAGGVAAVANRAYHNVASLLVQALHVDRNGSRPLISKANCWTDTLRKAVAAFTELENHHTPLSDRLYSVTQDASKDLLLTTGEFEQAFTRFEYYIALVYADLRANSGSPPMGPIGSFGWRYSDRHHLADLEMVKELSSPAEDSETGKALLDAGFFGGREDRMAVAVQGVTEQVKNLNWW